MTPPRGQPSRRRLLSALAATVSLALAGCPGRSGETPTSSDSATTPADAGRDDDARGSDATELGETERYVDATQRALVQNDYALVQRYTDGIDSTVVEIRTRSSRRDRRYRSVVEHGDETRRVYATDEARYTYVTDPSGERYERTPVERAFVTLHRPTGLASAESLGGILDAGTYGSGRLLQRADREVLRVTLETATADGPGTVIDADGSVIVSGGNVVYEARLTLTVERDGRTRTREQSVVVESLGRVDVTEPEWVETARQQG